MGGTIFSDGPYRAIVEGSTDGMWVFDLTGRTLYANPALGELLGIGQDDLAGLSVFDCLDDEGKGQLAMHLEELRQGRANTQDVECMFVRKDGSTLWVLIGETLLRDGDDVIGVLHRVTDYDQRRQLVDALVASQRDLDDSQRIARLGSWTWHLDTGVLDASPALYDLYGLPEGVPLSYDGFLARVHEEDLPEVEDAVARLHESAGGEMTFVARVQGETGLRWIRGRGVGHADETGRVVTVTGTHQDITETRQAEIALEDQVAQNLLMQAIASAANEARTLDDVLGHARSLVLLHDDWRRSRGFVLRADGTGIEPLYLAEGDEQADLETPTETAHELELATRCHRAKDVVWDEERLTLAFPVMYGEEVHAVLTITSDPPLYRYAMIESNARQVAVQLARVVEREMAERELQSARDAAMEASRQKSEFLARMSHEIRTPLNGVIGLNDLLLRSSLSAEQTRLSTGVRTAGETLLALINDILDFSKIEAGMLELEQVAFDPREVMGHSVDVLRESARSKGLDVLVRTDDDVPALLTGDPTRLGQVMLNLGANAIKFTSDGEVGFHASAERVDGRVRLRVEVSDTGIGLGGLDVDGLFDSFSQGDASTTRVHGGTGLGLAISREIVQAFGGQIGATPRTGRGSVFWFTALLDDADDAQAAAYTSTTAALPGGASVPRRPDGNRPKVLVVEDNDVNQMVAVGLLDALGCDSATAGDGLVALEALRDADYDLVLMDVQMPRLDGYSTTRAIRRGEAAGGQPRLPVVAMTAAAIEGERERALDSGMDDFLTKPVDPRQLGEVLNLWLTRAGVIEGTPTPAPAPAAGPVTPPTAAVVAAPAASENGWGAAGVDVERLDMLRDMADGDTSYLDRVIERFVIGSDTALVEIRAAVDRDDVAGLRQKAHRLAGTALNIGLVRVGETARELEHLADAGTTSGSDEVLPRLDGALVRGRQALVAYREQHSARHS